MGLTSLRWLKGFPATGEAEVRSSQAPAPHPVPAPSRSTLCFPGVFSPDPQVRGLFLSGRISGTWGDQALLLRGPFPAALKGRGDHLHRCTAPTSHTHTCTRTHRCTHAHTHTRARTHKAGAEWLLVEALGARASPGPWPEAGPTCWDRADTGLLGRQCCCLASLFAAWLSSWSLHSEQVSRPALRRANLQAVWPTPSSPGSQCTAKAWLHGDWRSPEGPGSLVPAPSPRPACRDSSPPSECKYPSE